MSSAIVPDLTVDASGLLCPMPVVRAKQAMDGLGPEQTMRLIATDPGAQADIPAWARSSGHTLLEATTKGASFVFLVKKG